MSAETEEFEFRLRAEKEASAQPKAQAAPNDLARVAAEANIPPDNASFLETMRVQPAAIQAGRAMVAPVEGAEQILAHVFGGKGDAAMVKQIDTQNEDRAKAMKELGIEHPLSRVAGTTADIATGAVVPASKATSLGGRMATNAATGGGMAALNPAVEGGSFLGEKGKQTGLGALAGGGLTGIIEGVAKIPGIGPKIMEWLKPKPTAAVAPRGEGAEKVAGELQRQRTALEGKEPPKGGSEAERAHRDFEERMKPLRDEAFRGPAVDSANAVKVLEDLRTKNPDPKVRSALDQAQKAIDNALEGASTKALPAAGSRVTPEQLRALQGQGGKMPVAMADEVRQSINRLIEQKGDAALDAHTKDVLGQVRDALVKSTPDSYKRYLQQYTEGVKALDPYKPMAGVTSGERGASAPTGSDAQARMAEIFKGKDKVADLKALVRDTGHDEAARKGLRDSYKEWLAPTDVQGHVDIAQAAKRWNDSKDAVKSSGMFEADHYNAVDKVLTDLSRRADATASAKTVAGALGSVFSYKGAVGARAAVSWLTRTGDMTREQVEGAILKKMTDPEMAGLLAAPPTPENLKRGAQSIAIWQAREAGKDEPRRSTPNPLGMRPAGI